MYRESTCIFFQELKLSSSILSRWSITLCPYFTALCHYCIYNYNTINMLCRIRIVIYLLICMCADRRSVNLHLKLHFYLRYFQASNTLCRKKRLE